MEPGPALGAAVEEYDRARRPRTASVVRQTRRRPAVAKVQRDADRLARASRFRSGLARGVRDAAIKAAARPGPSAKRYRQLQQEDPARLLADVRSVTGS